MSEKLPLDDIQGIILDDYFDMRLNYYLLFRIVEPRDTRRWLKEVVASALTSVKKAREYHATKHEDRDPEERFWNIAFTHRGLEALEVDQQLLDSFPFSFVEGSDTPDRARILGDVDDSAPEKWLFGSRKKAVHLLLMVYLPLIPTVSDKAKWEELRDRSEQLRKQVEENAGLELLHRESGGMGDDGISENYIDPLVKRLLADNKEHFGFRDSIAQPIPRGSGLEEDELDVLEPGEFLLGYQNQFSNEETGTIIKSHAPMAADGSVLGKNGSYLVFRQLEQDVVGFWQYCSDHAKGGANEETPYEPVTLASKMVGRWPSGAPLAKFWEPELGADNRDPDKPAPQPDDPDYYAKLNEYHREMNDIDYAEKDPKGERCPYGSHLRRSNPRNWEMGDTEYASLHISNLHRIIRRGRPYGLPLIDGDQMDTSTFPDVVREVLRIRDKEENERTPDEQALFDLSNRERGLHFLCFNSDIERQFEFVQQQWCNNPKFAGLNSDADPIVGWQRNEEKEDDGADGKDAADGADREKDKGDVDPPTFTIPSHPLRYRCTGMKRFVKVKGSGYFFMPSISDVARLGNDRWLDPYSDSANSAAKDPDESGEEEAKPLEALMFRDE